MEKATFSAEKGQRLELMDHFVFESGIRADNDHLFPPTPSLKIEQRVLEKWLAETTHITLEQLAHGSSLESALERVRSEYARQFVGGFGFGITARTISETRKDIPMLDSLLKGTAGKIVVIANGFSKLPLELAKRYKEGLLNEAPVIIDLFDYEKALHDFERLSLAFSEKGLKFPYQHYLDHARGIVEAVEEGVLQCVVYTVGSGDPPSQIKNADLAINVYGAPVSCLKEQISLLRAGGKLVITEDLSLRAFKVKGHIPPQTKFQVSSTKSGSVSIVEK